MKPIRQLKILLEQVLQNRCLLSVSKISREVTFKRNASFRLVGVGEMP